MKTTYWCTGSGRIELEMTAEDAAGASHSGSCDADVQALSQAPHIAAQLAKLNPQLLADELRDYGAWDADELADHDQNLQRVLWIAAGDISDGNCA